MSSFGARSLRKRGSQESPSECLEITNEFLPQKGGGCAEMENKSLEKRVLRRTKMVVGLRISQPEENASQLLVHTLDISSTGAKIGAVREYIQPGSVLLLQHGRNRAQCRVIWSRRVGPTEIQMGVEFLKHSARFWELDLDEGRAGVWLSLSQR